MGQTFSELGLRAFFILMLVMLVVDPANGFSKTVRLAGNNWSPYITFDEKGAAGGIAVDRITEILSLAGYSLQLVERPFKRALYEAEHGKVDGVLLLANRPERRSYLAFSLPVFCERRSIFTRADNVFDWRKPDAIRGRSMATGNGIFPGKIAEIWLEQGTISSVEVPNIEKLFDMLVLRRMDFAIFSDLEAEILLAANPATQRQIHKLAPPINNIELHIGFSKAVGGVEHAIKISQAMEKQKLGQGC